MAQSEKQVFLDAWEREAAVTMKVLRAFPAARADLKPGEKSKDAKDLAWTFVFEGFGASQAAQGDFKFPPPDMPPKPATWDGVVQECERGFRWLADKVRQADEAHLNTTVKVATGAHRVFAHRGRQGPLDLRPIGGRALELGFERQNRIDARDSAH